MRLAEYQHLASRTARREQVASERLVVAVLGLVGESGEVADRLKKHLGQGHDLDVNRVIEELGDVLWYVAETASALGVDLELVAEANLAKLRDRYPHGFDTIRSRERGDHG